MIEQRFDLLKVSDQEAYLMRNGLVQTCPHAAPVVTMEFPKEGLIQGNQPQAPKQVVNKSYCGTWCPLFKVVQEEGKMKYYTLCGAPIGYELSGIVDHQPQPEHNLKVKS